MSLAYGGGDVSPRRRQDSRIRGPWGSSVALLRQNHIVVNQPVLGREGEAP